MFVEARQVQVIDGRMHVALEYIAPSVEGALSTSFSLSVAPSSSFLF